MKKRKERCALCGHSHRALGIELLEDGTLLRRARASAHLLRNFGGAWAFSSRFWNAHAGEIRRVQIRDEESGMVYHASYDDFARYAFRRVLDVRAGEQIILPLSRWKQLETRTGGGDGAMLADASHAAETARTLQTARPVFGDRSLIAALRSRRSRNARH